MFINQVHRDVTQISNNNQLCKTDPKNNRYPFDKIPHGKLYYDEQSIQCQLNQKFAASEADRSTEPNFHQKYSKIDESKSMNDEYHRANALLEHPPFFHFQKSTQSQQASVSSEDNQMSIISQQQRHASFVKPIISKQQHQQQQQQQTQNSSYSHFHKQKQSSTLTKLKHKEKVEVSHSMKDQATASQAFMVTNCSQQRQRLFTTKAQLLPPIGSTNSILKNSQASRQGQNQTQQGPQNCQLIQKNVMKNSDKKQMLNRAQSLRTNSEVNFKSHQQASRQQEHGPQKLQTSTCFHLNNNNQNTNNHNNNSSGGKMQNGSLIKQSAQGKHGKGPLRPTSHNISNSNNASGQTSDKKGGANSKANNNGGAGANNGGNGQNHGNKSVPNQKSVNFTPQSNSLVKVSNNQQFNNRANAQGNVSNNYSNMESNTYTYERWQQIQQQNKDKFDSRQDILNPVNYGSYNEYLRSMTKHFNLDNPAPFISARSWIMMNLNTSEIMFAKQEKIQRQVASLTKVMTAHVVFDLLARYGLDWTKVTINVLTSSTTPLLGGTSAQLLPGDKLCVKELMYAMMLPSGNDAAQSLAIYFGNLCLLRERKGTTAMKGRGVGNHDANIYEQDYPEDEPVSDADQDKSPRQKNKGDDDEEEKMKNEQDRSHSSDTKTLDNIIDDIQQIQLNEKKYMGQSKVQQHPQSAPSANISAQQQSTYELESEGQQVKKLSQQFSKETFNDKESGEQPTVLDNEKTDEITQSSQRAMEPSNSEGSTQISSQQILALTKEKEDDGKQSAGAKEGGGEASGTGTVEEKPVKKTALQIKVAECLQKFYELMNEHAQSLGMKRSNFAVAHGMHNDNNYSTAADIGRLCCAAMKNDQFRSVVSVSNHKYHSTVYPGHVYEWENTNILLKQGYTGIKTGITNTAGPCLAASTIHSGYHVVVVLLSSCSMDSRWYEVPKIVSWGVKKIVRIRESKLRPKVKKKILKSITYI